MRTGIKRIGMICLIPVAFIMLLSVLLYLPPFQNFAIKKATAYASEATGKQIEIGQIRLSFPLDLTVRGVKVMESPSDTLLTMQSLTVSVRFLPLLKKEVLVNAIDLRGVTLNTGTLIDGMELQGVLGKLVARADRIDLSDEAGTLNSLELSDTAITLLLNDTTEKADTTTTPLNWLLKLEKITFNRVSFALQMPADSLRLTSYIDQALLEDGTVDLGAMRYGARHFSLSGSTLSYDSNYGTPVMGFDPAHIALSNLDITLDNALYSGRIMEGDIRRFAAVERSGLTVVSLLGSLRSDSTAIHLPELRLNTTGSEVTLTAQMPWSVLNEISEGDMQATLRASLSKEDVMIAAGILPDDFKKTYPNRPLSVDAVLDGNLTALHLRQLKGELPGAFRLTVSGDVEAVTDSIHRSGELRLQAETGELDFLLSYLPKSSRSYYRLPAGIRLAGEATLANQEYHAALKLTEDRGLVALTARYHTARQTYAADLRIDSLEPTHFMPYDSLYWLTASAQAEGQGVDLYAASTRVKMEGKVLDIRYGTSSVSDINLTASLLSHQAKAELVSHYPLARMTMTVDGTLERKQISGMLIADMEHLDLYALHFVNKPLATSFQLFAEAGSDQKRNHRIDLTLGNWELITPKGTVRPKTLTLHAHSNQDTTAVSFHAGDLGLMLTGTADLDAMTQKLSTVSKELSFQLERDTMIDFARLRPVLPDMHLEVRAGRDNPIYNYLQQSDISFERLTLDASTSPETGFQMDGAIYALTRDTMRLDTIRTWVRQDLLGLRYSAEVIKNQYRKQQPFFAELRGQIQRGSADARLRYTDGGGKTGLLVGIRADKVAEGVRFHLFPEEPILAFRPFRLNKDNYVLIKNMKDIEANLRLSGEDNASLWIHSLAEADHLQELHAEFSQMDLEILSTGFPDYLPEMKGILNADFQYAPSDSSFMLVADVNVDNLIYRNGRVGELMSNVVYLPLETGDHQVDMHLFRDQNEILAATAFYRMGERDSLSGDIHLTSLPLEMLNPFIPLGAVRMAGTLQGNMSIQGQSSAPVIQGFMRLDTASVFVAAAGESFRFDTKRIEVADNLLSFNNYAILAAGKNPFVIDGTIDFHNPSRMMANLKLKANDMQLLNVKRNNESLVYGKLFVNLNSTVKGALDALIMRGDLQLLGNTDLTYVLKDSPLTVQDRLADLVTFTSFTDTVQVRKKQEVPLPLGGMDILMTIRIDPAVQLKADLSADQSSRVELEGGGDLSFQYTPQGDMILNGRYTLSGGTLKYALPVIPSKLFTIQNGSYVDWTGNAMDPTLNLIATERVRTSVSLDDQTPRLVNFDVGIEVKQKLENLSLQFTLEAPEDMAVQTQLSAMGAEERSKQAVSMLVTGMYLAGSGSGKMNMDMGAALTSFLQSEINNIAGSALKSVDISFGMESYDQNGTDGGGKRTDYSFRFAKRFYNDRIRVVLGGRISTGGDVNEGQTQPFIDNISVEYRLDASGTRYVKLFHNKDYESLLEGELTETGAGIVLRKKMKHLRELFNFRKRKVKPVAEAGSSFPIEANSILTNQ